MPKKSRLNQGSNPQPPGHESDTLITEPARQTLELEHRNKEDQLQNSCSLKVEGIELSYLVHSIILWISTKFVHLMYLRSKLGRSRWSQVRTLVTSIFSFSHNVFYAILEELHHLSHIEIVICKFVQFWIRLEICKGLNTIQHTIFLLINAP